MKVLLILVDGMRPDSLTDIPEVEEMKKRSSYSFASRTVVPSYTLPCHMSLFHSVEPTRHGTASNTFAPQVRPIEGLCEVLKKRDLHSTFFYSWEELRDITRPGSLNNSYFLNGHYDTPYEEIGRRITDLTIAHLQGSPDDFIFCYLGWPDEAGHEHGWMSEEYLRAIRDTWKGIRNILAVTPDDYTVIITADHGGHDRTHGTDMVEDTTIPVFFCGPDFEQGREIEPIRIMDIAPTITKLMGITSTPKEWEGKSLV